MKAPLELTRNPWLMRRGQNLVELIYMLSRVPGVRHVHPWARPGSTDMRWLPINEDIGRPEGAPLPLALLDRFIEESSHRVILDYCGCRTASECSDYPVDVGCLMIGDAAPTAAPSISREVGVDEAKAHARRAVSAGLVPVVGIAAVDRAVFRVKDPHRMLTVCLCCPCCCLGRYNRHLPQESLEATFPWLDGVRIEVTDACTGCGTCAPACYLGAIDIEGGRAVHSDVCRACGRCALACPSDAVEIEITDPGFLEAAYERILERVDHR